MKGHLPFAFIIPSTANPQSKLPDDKFSPIPPREHFKEINDLVREQIGTIANLGGIIQGRGMIPKTRSGKTLRRCLRELVENGVNGEFDKEVQVPATVEDREVVEVARRRVKEYFEAKKNEGGKSKL